MGMGGNEGQEQSLKGANRNAGDMRQLFRRIGEPLMTPALMALMGRAGLVPASILGSMRGGGQQGQQGQQGNQGPPGSLQQDVGALGAGTSPAGAGGDPMGQLAQQFQRRGAGGPPQSQATIQRAIGGPTALGAGAPGASKAMGAPPMGAPPMGAPPMGAPGGAGGDPMGQLGAMFGGATGVTNGPRFGIGQGLAGVQRGSTPPGPMMGAPGAPGAPGGAKPLTLPTQQLGGMVGGAPPGPLQGAPPPTGFTPPVPLPSQDDIRGGPPQGVLDGQNQLGAGPGWTDQDRVRFNQGRDSLDANFNRSMGQGMNNIQGRMGDGANSIAAGLQAKGMETQANAYNQLNTQVNMAGIEEERKRILDLINALGPMMGMGGQAAQINLGAAGGYGQMAAQNDPMKYLAAAGAFAPTG